MHFFVYSRLRKAFHPGQLTSYALIAWMSFMTVIPLLVRLAEHSGNEAAAPYLAWPGYLWMGFLLIFSSILFFIDVSSYTYRFIRRRVSPHHQFCAAPGVTCSVALLIAVTASIYATIEAEQIRSEHVVIASDKIASSTPRIRIVQISDVHVGLLLEEKRFQNILSAIEKTGPDILVCTGDLVDGKLNRDDMITGANPYAARLAALSAPGGKYAVIGNHEVYAGLPQSLAFSQSAGYILLRNRSVHLANGITITGIDDQAANPGRRADPAAEAALIKSVPHESFQLLLKHRPEIEPENDGRFDLQLSGHVHDGQIFPFNFLVRLQYPIPCGTTITKAGSRIHVSRGTGTWGPPMRLFAPPEITVIDIISQPHR